jgi:hypothetical protein
MSKDLFFYSREADLIKEQRKELREQHNRILNLRNFKNEDNKIQQ